MLQLKMKKSWFVLEQNEQAVVLFFSGETTWRKVRKILKRSRENIHKELVHFESQKYKDFQATILSYLESLMDNQQQVGKF